MVRLLWKRWNQTLLMLEYICLLIQRSLIWYDLLIYNMSSFLSNGTWFFWVNKLLYWEINFNTCGYNQNLMFLGWSWSVWFTICVPRLCSSVNCWWRDADVYSNWYGSPVWRQWRSLLFQVILYTRITLHSENESFSKRQNLQSWDGFGKNIVDSFSHFVAYLYYELDMVRTPWKQNIAMKWLCGSSLHALRYVLIFNQTCIIVILYFL